MPLVARQLPGFRVSLPDWLEHSRAVAYWGGKVEYRTVEDRGSVRVQWQGDEPSDLAEHQDGFHVVCLRS